MRAERKALFQHLFPLPPRRANLMEQRSPANRRSAHPKNSASLRLGGKLFLPFDASFTVLYASRMLKSCAAVLAVVATLPALNAQKGAGEWPTYNRDLAGTRYSPLAQI